MVLGKIKMKRKNYFNISMLREYGEKRTPKTLKMSWAFAFIYFDAEFDAETEYDFSDS